MKTSLCANLGTFTFLWNGGLMYTVMYTCCAHKLDNVYQINVIYYRIYYYHDINNFLMYCAALYCPVYISLVKCLQKSTDRHKERTVANEKTNQMIK